MIIGDVVNLNFFNFVGKMYVACAMLRNALTCLYKNQTSEYLQLEPSILCKYCKIPKISPSMYKPPKTLPYIAPPNISLPGCLYLEFPLEYKVKQSKNGKFPSNYLAGPIDFETQISLRS